MFNVVALVGIIFIYQQVDLWNIVQAQEELAWGWLPKWGVFLQPVALFLFLAAAVAENKRVPFDLPEAESELVAGYQVEYSSTLYLLFMLGEYMNIVLMCAMTTILFLGGWHPLPFLGFIPGVIWFIFKVCAVFFMFAMVKAIVPRYRYDQLMRLGWKVFLPLSLAAVAIVAFILQLTGWGGVPVAS